MPIRPNVLRMHPYTPGKPIAEAQRELGLERVVKLASNENPLGPSPKAIESVKRAAEEMHLYPDATGHELKEALSKRFDLPTNQIVLGSGSDELIHLLGLVFLGSEDDEVLVGDPSFVRYDAAAQLAPAKLIKVPLDQDYKHDLWSMAQRATDKTKLVFIANPNNPTGTIVLKPELDRFLQDLPPDAVTVLDEAYFEFAADVPNFPNSLEYVRAGKNVVGLRTFSKTYGLAGIRIGYAFASSEIADGLERVRAPFNVSSLAQAAAVAAISDEEHITRTVANNREGVREIKSALEAAGAKACESYANFVFADLGRPAKPIYDQLLARGVIVRPIWNPNCLRVSVGTPEEVAIFKKAFEAVMAVAIGA
jgi:histidinol-phosphate aminotransferase